MSTQHAAVAAPTHPNSSGAVPLAAAQGLVTQQRSTARLTAARLLRRRRSKEWHDLTAGVPAGLPARPPACPPANTPASGSPHSASTLEVPPICLCLQLAAAGQHHHCTSAAQLQDAERCLLRRLKRHRVLPSGQCPPSCQLADAHTHGFLPLASKR